jgi:hypothetical protein
MNIFKQFMKQCIFGIVLCYLVFSPALVAPKKADAYVLNVDVLLNPLMKRWTKEDLKLQREATRANVQKQTAPTVSDGSASPMPQGYSSAIGTLVGLVAGIPKTLFWGALNYKTMLKALVKNLIKSILQDVTSWAKGGFKGKPNFIADWKGMLAASALDASSELIRAIPEIARFCSPVGVMGSKDFFGKALTQGKPTFSKYVQKEFKPTSKCNLETVFNNIENAPGDFKKSIDKMSKSWDKKGGSVMASALMAPDVNMLGAFFIAKDESLVRVKQGAQAKLGEAAANNGFLNISDGCVGSPDPATGEKYCPAKMAGTFVKDSITKSGLGQFSDMIDMNDMNDLFTATLNEVVSGVTGSITSYVTGLVGDSIKNLSM